MHMRLSVLLIAVLPMSASAELKIEYRADQSMGQHNEDSLFSVPQEYQVVATDSRQQEVLINHEQDGLRVLLMANASTSDIASNTQTVSSLQEMVYDFHMAEREWSVGKKVVSWGVGYGFRPLDIVQQESRLQWQALSLEGVPMLSMESFDSDHADSWVLFRDAQTQAASGMIDRTALAYQHYLLLEHSDLYTVAMLDEQGRYSLGAGISQVPGESMEWHGSLLYTSQYEKFIRAATAPLLASSDPFILQSYQGGGQVLLGASWTWASGMSMMLEAWYDPAAYSQSEWRDLLQLSAQQAALLGSGPPAAAIYNNLNWNSRAFQNASLMQENILLRMSYSGEGLEPELYFLYAPEDGGYIANLTVTKELGENTRLFAGWRQFGGNRDSVYAQLPTREMIALGFSLAGLW